MTEEVKKKSTNVEDVLEMVRTSSNKGLGNAGTCSTAAATAAKEVTLGSTFELVDGATILVTFQNAITSAGATLAVTHTPLGESEAVTEAAKPIYHRGVALPANLVKAGDRITLRYDGTRYNVVGTIDQDLGGKADKASTVSDVTYDSSTGKLNKTINGTTTNICDVVTSGFRIEYSSSTGIKSLTPVGGAVGAFDNSTGIKAITF